MSAFIIAFSTYSRIPMPQVEWNEKHMKYAICFFPLVGAVVGLLALGWGWLCRFLDLGELLQAAGWTALPLLVTGGIHMDGFCDTVDALSSHQSRERKLEILKDSHTGAFAVIFCGVWLLLYTGAVSQAPFPRGIGVLGLGLCALPGSERPGPGQLEGRPSLRNAPGLCRRLPPHGGHRNYGGLSAAGRCGNAPVLSGGGRCGSPGRRTGFYLLPAHVLPHFWGHHRRSGRIFRAAVRAGRRAGGGLDPRLDKLEEEWK